MRLLTALCVIGLCAFATARGWRIWQFAATRAQVIAHQIPADAVRSWIGAPGLASAALYTLLTEAPATADRDASRRRTDALAALLAVRPMSSTDWLSLAGMRLVMGQPHQKVLAGLLMSSITGPNEAAVMVQRAIFGLLQWKALPADARHRTIRDLAGAARADAIGDGAMADAKNVLRTKSAETRAQIAGLLRAAQVPAAKLARMGLSVAPADGGARQGS